MGLKGSRRCDSGLAECSGANTSSKLAQNARGADVSRAHAWMRLHVMRVDMGPQDAMLRWGASSRMIHTVDGRAGENAGKRMEAMRVKAAKPVNDLGVHRAKVCKRGSMRFQSGLKCCCVWAGS